MEEVKSVVAERNSNTYKRWSKTRPQHMAAYGAALFGVCAGALDGWTASAIPYLQKSENFTVPGITYREASWIVSLCHLGSLFGAIPAGYLANLVGRRQLMLIMAVPMFLSWLMILSGQNSIPLLYLARFIQGFTCGVVSVAYYLYCDEIAEDRVRGDVGNYLDLLITVGMVYVYSFGAIISHMEMTITCTVLPVLFAVIFYLMPESPLYLLTKGQKVKAKKSLRWLRGAGTGQIAEIEGELNEMRSLIMKLRGVGTGHSAEIEGELNEMESYIKKFGTGHSVEIEGELNEMKSLINRPSESKSFSTFFRKFSENSNTDKDSFKSFSTFFRRGFENSKTDNDIKTAFVLMVFRQLCGMHAVRAYTVHVFETAGSSWDPYLCTAVFGVAQFVSNLIPNFVVRLDRKSKFPTISGAGMGVCLLAIVLHSLLNPETDKKYLDWLPLIAVNLYIFSFSVGLGPVPWFIRSDRLCKEDRDWVVSIAVCLNSGLAFFVTKFFPIMMNDFGSDVTYGTLAVICFVGTIVIRRWFNGERECINPSKNMKLERL